MLNVQINKHGLLQLPPSKNARSGIHAEDSDVIRDLVLRQSPADDLEDMLIIFNALVDVSKLLKLPVIAC